MSYQPKVLVVDDDANILSAFDDFLRKEHCIMIAASTAEEALKKLGQQHVHLVITDVRLKAQSGVTLFMKIKQLQPSLPVIVITGHPNLITEKEIRHYGADYYFLKPLELDQLRGAVRKCLHLSGVSADKHE